MDQELWFQGFWNDLVAGNLEGPFDLRLAICGPGFSYDPDAVNVADGTLDEHAGTNYARLDVANAEGGYDATANEWRVTCDSEQSFADPDPPIGEDVEPTWLVAIRHVDGTDANDIILSATTIGMSGVIIGGGDAILIVDEYLMYGRPRTV